MPRPIRQQTSVSSASFHHCISRVVDRNFVFGARERDVFRKVLRQVEEFSGVRVITWTMLSNHFHVLVELAPPPAEAPSDAQILQRCRALYAPRAMDLIEWELDDARRHGGEAHERARQRYLARMWNLSEFMKTLKQKFTGWFNRGRGRVGTLWESRFKSVHVEGDWNCLLKVAAYIDLNAVRAGLVGDPKDYRWCGYGEAEAGDRAARRGLSAALHGVKAGASWRDVGPRYRKILFGIGEGRDGRAGFSREEIAKVWAAGGKLTLAQLLRCKVRYFSDGLAVGSEAFIEGFFRARRGAFSERRRSGAHKMEGGDWGELRTARALAASPVAPPDDG